MAIPRRRVDTGKIQLGTSIKSVLVEGITTVREVAGTVTDVAIALRGGVELVHLTVEEAVIEARTDVALTTQAGLDRLIGAGMSEAEARRYLQCEHMAVPSKLRIQSPDEANGSKQTEE